MTDQIKFEPILPPMPMVLADSAFLKTLSDVEAQVTSLKITDAQSAQHGANLQIRLTSAGKKLEETRLGLKRPFIDISAMIDSIAREPAARIEAAKTRLRNAQIEWDTTQRRLAREAEEARQKEIERLEAKRREEEAEAKRKAAEIARLAAEEAAKTKPPVIDVDFGDDLPAEPPQKTATELEIDRLKYTPAPVAAKPAGLTFRVRLIHKVESIALLPETFVTKTANDASIRATFCSGWKDGDPLPTLPGVKFEIERTPVSTGRGGVF